MFSGSGSLLLAHVGLGVDLARASSGLRFEVRSYFRPAESRFDLLEVLGSFQFRMEE